MGREGAGRAMSDPVTTALISAIVVPLIAGAIAAFKGLYSDNRESWKQRAESAEGREAELKAELLPAVKNAVDGVKALADGQEKDREMYRRIAPALESLEATVGRIQSEGGGDRARTS